MAQITQNTGDNPSSPREFKPTVCVFVFSARFCYNAHTERIAVKPLGKVAQESEQAHQTGQDTAQRGRKSPFDTVNLKHLLSGLHYCTSLESNSKAVCSNVCESRLLSAPCRSGLAFLLAAK